MDEVGSGLVFRYQDSNNYYRMLMVKDKKVGGPYLSLDKKEDGKIQNIKKITSGPGFFGNYDIGKWYNLKIIIRGSDFELFVEGVSALKATDKTFECH